ncbi:MAG: hypothetical protein KatS3mg083_144 [Candidatus Dojkabacteria bacterium]|nr:MAG: hypothetical protein KatS3mg083_144 [Candidatus Dojkabacteria bacterium]
MLHYQVTPMKLFDDALSHCYLGQYNIDGILMHLYAVFYENEVKCIALPIKLTPKHANSKKILDVAIIKNINELPPDALDKLLDYLSSNDSETDDDDGNVEDTDDNSLNHV